MSSLTPPIQKNDPRDQASLPLKPTTKLIVKLEKEGVQLHGPRAAPVYTLKFHELVALSELETGDFLEAEEVAASVTAQTGVEEAVVQSFVKFLTRSARLRRRLHAIPSAELQPLPPLPKFDASVLDQQSICLHLPLPLRLYRGQFQLIDHDGRLVLALSAAELIALAQFVQPITFANGLRAQQDILTQHAVDEAALSNMLLHLHAVGLLATVEPAEIERKAIGYRQILDGNVARHAAELDRLESLRQQRTGVVRAKVIPVSFGECIPAALGLVVAYAKVYDGGSLDEFYDFRLDWVWDEKRSAAFFAKPAIYLFSNYLWTHEKSIAVSDTIKQSSPGSITIHGGPDTPKYDADVREHFARYPHVDVIVHGEGEATLADTLDKLRSVIGAESPDMSVLTSVPGISYQYRGEVFRNPDRERIEDLDTIPSPYLMGLFEVFRGVPRLHVTLETNRGCPYGCTFCDWGSATLSKIRKFDLDRVFGDLEWCAHMKVHSVGQADANFGVFERDVEIAQRVAELKLATGYPETFGGSYAKNSTKYLQKIIKILADAGILTQGMLSLQTMDDNTLSVIKRSNIKVEKYDALANEMRASNLALTVELMMGLPGATLQSFIGDLQQCIDRDIPARINQTTLLVNSPMNSPDYRAEHEITTGAEPGPGRTPVLVSTKTYTREDMARMMSFRDVYLLLDNFGVMRLCSRFVRQQTGMTETEFYQALLTKAGSYNRQHKWPLLNMLVNYGHELMAPTYSWALLYAELREFLVAECNVPDDSALDAILLAQHAVQPTHGRKFPVTIELPHDVVAWHVEMLRYKAAGYWQDWHVKTSPLSSFGPGRLEVNDVDGSVTRSLGCDVEMNAVGVNWDMDSGIARARLALEFNAVNLNLEETIRIA